MDNEVKLVPLYKVVYHKFDEFDLFEQIESCMLHVLFI